ncbi:hypothetical protein LCGC14_1544890 [marine sediment metagenome]|uniref:Uncharacterized protein n=1 Tax=marine sediment metagenome TaxID=412755 RepID=A0A0F9JCV1_9ZZZZ
MVSKGIINAERCQVGITKDGKYQVWHKVMGKGTPPKFVNRDEVMHIVDELLTKYKSSRQISKEDFEAYEKVRESGVTNMFDVTTVCGLSGLSRETCLEIMKDYGSLCKEFPGVRRE